MKEIKKYMTADSKVFNTKKEAEMHEKELTALANVKLFKLYTHPDLCEGLYPALYSGVIAVCAKEHHKELAEYAAEREFGNRWGFVAVSFGDYPTQLWRIDDDDTATFDDIVCTVQANFMTDPLYKVGVAWCDDKTLKKIRTNSYNKWYKIHNELV